MTKGFTLFCQKELKLKNKRLFWNIFTCTIIAIAGILLDLVLKEVMFNKLPNEGDSMKGIDGFFNFVHVENGGAGYGILSGKRFLLIFVSIIVLGAYILYYVLDAKKNKDKTSFLLSVSLGLIGGGCVGNLVDRIFIGKVRDFINLQFMTFPVFNIADILLTVGVILAMIYFIFIYPRMEKKRLQEEKDNTSSPAVSITLPDDEDKNER